MTPLKSSKVKICVAGQNNIAVYFTEFLLNQYPEIEVYACLNKNDDGINKFHRSFKAYCELNKIPIKTLEEIYSENNIIFLSTEFDKIIKTDKFKTNRLFNIHFSLLPEYKGMFTSALPILHGKDYSGVTLHRIDDGIDTGAIIAQKKFKIDQESCESLYNLYTSQGLNILKKYFPSILENTVSFKHQSQLNSTYFSKKTIDYSNVRIDLNTTAYQIDSQVRAFYFPFKQVPIIHGHKVYKTEILDFSSQEKPGTLIKDTEFFLILNTIDYQIKIFKYKMDLLTQKAIEGDLETIKYYYKNGYDLKKKNSEGRDLLMIAAYNGHLDLIKYLIEQLKWDVNTCNYNGTTYLMYSMTNSSKTNDMNILDYALKQKIKNKNRKDYKGLNIMDYAKILNNPNVLDKLSKFGCKPSI